MLVFNEKNTRKGTYDRLNTSLLIGESNSGCEEVSIQITHVEPNGEQTLHSHPEHQCYYIIAGSGCMRIDGEERQVYSGDAVYIPGGSVHGILNNASETLIYLTANKAFGTDREMQIWRNS